MVLSSFHSLLLPIPFTFLSVHSFSLGFIFPLYLILPFTQHYSQKPLLRPDLCVPLLIHPITYFNFTTGKYPSSDPVSVYYSVQCYPSSPSSILYLSFLLFSTDVFTTQVTSVQHGYLIQTNQDHQMNTHIND